MKFSTILAATTALLTGANAAVPRLVEVQSHDVCWRVCFPEKPHCPDGWDAKKIGHCYSCCKNFDDEAAEASKLDMFWQA
ncbi:hypothetical protein BDV32DRAFT_146903 [Aspergillus pseudonomiae]|uniref:Uncharacterized protein n=1 Tax=Aspergillus pseudonomiae TaxID=1506151 RepID=A0A5N7DT09_9EURO|nr:uncharacterized protein BDV37DRAFT_278647 [Aspergillus pseudonomiae]KAB8263113.1 hypothetical protein BDV32DRAFT_146903 [Aspergillus pseudonomiae]KAE8408638.1 hypothetical protein BDV37DRAFT_278647 [Aspergillus pseudonomiae]